MNHQKTDLLAKLCKTMEEGIGIPTFHLWPVISGMKNAIAGTNNMSSSKTNL